MSDCFLLIKPDSKGESGILYKYIRLWIIAWTDKNSKWTKKGKQKYIDHAEKIRRHITWLLSRRYKDYKSWQMKVLGSHSYLDLKRHHNQEFLMIIYFE